jgi:tetratricopeptide (TPR) repeat protein
MQPKDIHHIVDRIKKVEGQEEQTKLIVLLGAGASVSAGIPLAYKVTKDIVEVFFKDKPEIMDLKPDERNNYYKVMGCLNAAERHKVLREYINHETVRINAAHLYLADLLKKEYVDYILTVNFDDLILRAAALLNFIPPVYDLSILKAEGITTSNFQKGAVIYLHGQHHGHWLLNTEGELEEIGGAIQKLLGRICEGRTWVVVGYSGKDDVISQIAQLGRFDNELFWVGYNNDKPGEEAEKYLLSRTSNDVHWVPRYDADTFFHSLHSQLKIGTPDLLHKPFSFLHNMINRLKDAKDIDTRSNERHKSFDLSDSDANGKSGQKMSGNRATEVDQLMVHRKRIEMIKKLIDDTILRYENIEFEKQLTNDEIIAIHTELYEDGIVKSKEDQEAEKTDGKAHVNDDIEKATNIKRQIAGSYNDEGIQLRRNNRFEESFKKYKMATELWPENATIYYNWGNALFEFALRNKDESLLAQASEKYSEAVKRNPDYTDAYYNWGTVLSTFARLTNNIIYYKESLPKYERAAQLNPHNAATLFNWGIALGAIGETERDTSFLRESIKKYKQANRIDENDAATLNNWGAALATLAELDKENAISLLRESLEKYEEAASLDEEYPVTFYNWGNALSSLANLVDDIDEKVAFFKASFEKYQYVTEKDPNDAVAFNNWALALSDRAQLNGNIHLFQESFQKFQKAVEIDPNCGMAYYNWSGALLHYADLLPLGDRRTVFSSARDKANEAVRLNHNGAEYNLACSYARLEDKKEALFWLEESLNANVVTPQYVFEDKDWAAYREDPEFLNIVKRFRDLE